MVQFLQQYILGRIDKRVWNFLVIILLSFISFFWTFFIFHKEFDLLVVLSVVFVRILASIFIFHDYSLSWSKVSTRTFLLKSVVYIIAFIFYVPVFYQYIEISFLVSELFLYIFSINFLMYLYHFLINRNSIKKTKTVVIYGAGKVGMKLEEEFKNTEYKVECFIDDCKVLQKRSIDGIEILPKDSLKKIIQNSMLDLLVVTISSLDRKKIQMIHEEMQAYFKSIKVLSLGDKNFEEDYFSSQLKEISIEDFLARYPKDLDKEKIESFIHGKTILITGAGGSIGSEISRQCKKYGASKLILLDHSEFNLYSIDSELENDEIKIIPVMQSVRDLNILENTFEKYKPQVVIHAAAYKHVPLVEENMLEGISNNIIGTKNCIDLSIKFEVEKFVLISTDKAVRPTNVMGCTKRVCELYAQNVKVNLDEQKKKTEIVAVRFGNVLGSSGSVIPKFKSQIEQGKNLTVTHPDITRYFMLIPEACELVLQAGAIAKGGEIFILDMGEPIKIVDLAKKMIELSGRDDISIEFCGLRQGEKLYEELLINDSDKKTEYESITVASPTYFEIELLNKKIDQLLSTEDKIAILKEIVPEFDHRLNG